jgi:hypothetical protein
LKRIVEFLNLQMNPAEVLAVELRQYVGEGLKTLVPIVFGQTDAAQSKKGKTGAEAAWSRDKILAAIGERCGNRQAAIAAQLADWMAKSASKVWFSNGVEKGTMGTMFRIGKDDINPFILRSDGQFRVAFQYMMKGHFREEAVRQNLQTRLNRIQGISIPDDSLTRRPGIPLSSLEDGRVDQLLDVLNWFVSEVQAERQRLADRS